MPQDLAKLKEMWQMAKGTLTKEEFTKAFAKVMEIVIAMEKRNISDRENFMRAHQQLLAKVQGDHSTSLSDLKKQVNAEIESSLTTKVDAKLATVKDGAKGDKGVRGAQGLPGRDGRPGRDGVNGKDGKDGKNGLNGRIMTPAKAFMVHKTDLTSQCNGSNKTFSVGGTHFGIMGVFGTEAPLIYRPIIDYTETATGFTLTSAVSAPATGQTLVAQWLK